MKWTYREIYLLKQHYATAPVKKLEELLPKRNYKAMRQKARKLGLKRDRAVYEKTLFQKGQKSWNKGKTYTRRNNA
jgi:hypothetical protein